MKILFQTLVLQISSKTNLNIMTCGQAPQVVRSRAESTSHWAHQLSLRTFDARLCPLFKMSTIPPWVRYVCLLCGRPDTSTTQEEGEGRVPSERKRKSYHPAKVPFPRLVTRKLAIGSSDLIFLHDTE